MAITHGMNPDEVEGLGQFLREQGSIIEGIVSDIQKRIGDTSWVGRDAEDFKGPWWDGHKGNLSRIASELQGFGDSACNNAQEQREVSGR